MKVWKTNGLYPQPQLASSLDIFCSSMACNRKCFKSLPINKALVWSWPRLWAEGVRYLKSLSFIQSLKVTTSVGAAGAAEQGRSVRSASNHFF